MLRSAAGKVMWVGRATVFLVGLAVILALVFGAASTALGANGQAWILGQGNAATAITKLAGAAGVNGPMLQLINNNAGTNDTALDLRVQAGETPMRVNSATKVANLNADKLDGNDSTQIGINGLERVFTQSALNSDSPKSANASCPSGKVVIGTGFHINDGKRIVSPGQEQTDLSIDDLVAGETFVNVIVYEEEPTSASWSVVAQAICAKAP